MAEIILKTKDSGKVAEILFEALDDDNPVCSREALAVNNTVFKDSIREYPCQSVVSLFSRPLL